ncbi:MAG: periplasmic heavy metal sensor [bacterium]|nr:periplasmic heavy metal sensor [bacterium]
MTKKRWLVLGLVLALVVIVVGIVVAEQQNKPKAAAAMMPGSPPYPMPGQEAGFGGGPMMGGGGDQLMMWERAAKALDLSADQKKNIETIFLDNKKKNIQLKAELEVQQIDLLIALREVNTDEAKVKEIAKRIGKLTAEMIETGINDILKAKKVLTPEQQEKAMQMIQKFKQHQPQMGPGQQPMGPGPGMMRPGQE